MCNEPLSLIYKINPHCGVNCYGQSMNQSMQPKLTPDNTDLQDYQCIADCIRLQILISTVLYMSKNCNASASWRTHVHIVE